MLGEENRRCLRALQVCIHSHYIFNRIFTHFKYLGKGSIKLHPTVPTAVKTVLENPCTVRDVHFSTLTMLITKAVGEREIYFLTYKKKSITKSNIYI